MSKRRFLSAVFYLAYLWGFPVEASVQTDTRGADRVQASVDRCVALYRRGDLPGAIHELHTALRLRPDDPHLHFMLGNALYRNKDLQEAADEYGTTVQLSPAHFEAHMSRGFVLFELRQFPDALAEWTVAMRLQPNEPFARAALAVGLYENGEVAEAKSQYAKALALDPRYAETQTLRLDFRWKQHVLDNLRHLAQGTQ